jgi:hypothetical protein
MSSKIEQAAEVLGELAQRHFPVSTLTTYKVGGTAALFCRVNDLATLLKSRHKFKKNSEKECKILRKGFSCCHLRGFAFIRLSILAIAFEACINCML